MPYSVERYHDFCAGHRVVGHEGKCKHLHGHNYRVYFTVEPMKSLDDVGRVVDFSMIKSTLCQWLEDNWDHKMLLWIDDPSLPLVASAVSGVVAVSFNPTAENMAQYLVESIGPLFLDAYEVRLVKCRIEETRKCAAIYELEDR